jgi:sec-independent protein translocase protein TatC
VDDKEYTLVEHLAELRKRLGYAVAGVLVATVAAFVVSEQLLHLLRDPMETALRAVHGDTAKFMVTGAAEYIICQMKAALVAAIFIASPWILYQIWQFVAPGLFDHERRYALAFIWAGALFFCAGGAFCYLAVFPSMFEFLVKSIPPDIAMMPSLEEHFSFTLKMLLAFAVVFETPVFIFVLSMAGIVDPRTLGQYRRYVVVIALIIGAVLTPTPDWFSQMLLAGPIIVLFEVGVLVSRLAVTIAGNPLSREARAAAHEKKNEQKNAKDVTPT